VKIKVHIEEENKNEDSPEVEKVKVDLGSLFRSKIKENLLEASAQPPEVKGSDQFRKSHAMLTEFRRKVKALADAK